MTNDESRMTNSESRMANGESRMTDDARRMTEPTNPAFRPLSSAFYLILILLFGLVVISPLLQPGYFWGAHDARHAVYFIFEYDKAVQDGIWLPGWGPDWAFGYGYPFWIVYGPLATFLGELLHHFLGLGFE
ncbi:MAG: hypothetical protein WHX53_07600, partial [Anaerolineae bacterium]